LARAGFAAREIDRGGGNVQTQRIMNQENNFSDRATKVAEEAVAFQKIWLETWSKILQAGFTVTPDSAPPELMRQIRGGIFRALSESWEEFLRSPQFLEGMKQWMESAISFRKMTNEFLTNVRHELQAPSREDIDTILLTVRHLETRLLDRLEEIGVQQQEILRKIERLEESAVGRQPPVNNHTNQSRPAARRRTKTPNAPRGKVAP